MRLNERNYAIYCIKTRRFFDGHSVSLPFTRDDINVILRKTNAFI